MTELGTVTFQLKSLHSREAARLWKQEEFSLLDEYFSLNIGAMDF